ncbi:MAG: DUF2058 family protein [Pseudomonadota bacterium]
MAGSTMADQLRSLGLAKEKKKPAKRRKKKRPAKSPDGDISLASAYAARARDEKSEKERTAREKRERQALQREQNLKLEKLLKPVSQNKADAEEHRFFEFAGKIRKVFVTPEQQEQLNRGELGIVALRGGYHLVEPDVVKNAAAIRADSVALDPAQANEAADPSPKA